MTVDAGCPTRLLFPEVPSGVGFAPKQNRVGETHHLRAPLDLRIPKPLTLKRQGLLFFFITFVGSTTALFPTPNPESLLPDLKTSGRKHKEA